MEVPMNPDRWTLKTQEAVQGAQRLAEELSHQELSEEHLLAALLRQGEGVAAEILRKAGADPKRAEQAA